MSDMLKPCPFCGKSPSGIDQMAADGWDVECYCHAGVIICGPEAKTKDAAIEAWNTRATRDAYEPMLAALEAMNSHIEAMQSQMAQFVEPSGYTSFDRKSIAFEKDRETQNKMFVQDMIYLLDGPEQRKAQKLARAAIAQAKGEAQ